jgi:Ca-activated chloride channel family protein
MLNFENPAAFLLLLFIPLLYIFRHIGFFSRPAFPLNLSDWNGKSFSWKSSIFTLSAGISEALCIAGFVLAVLAAAVPVVHHQRRVYTSRGTDIVFVLDTSPSMAAKDIAYMTRFEAAKQAIRTLIQENSGASFGLVAMATQAAVVVPPTIDHTAFLDALDHLVIGTLGEGSAIGVGLSTAVYHLVSSDAPKKCIVLITDGENNAGSIHPATAAALAKEKGITLYTLGIGTTGSVPLEYIDPASGKVYSGYLDSGFNAAYLEQLALAGGGRYFEVQSSGELSTALNDIRKRENVIQSYHLRTEDDAFYDEFILAAAACFFLAWMIRRVYMKEVL